jgi:hypothetical protein
LETEDVSGKLKDMRLEALNARVGNYVVSGGGLDIVMSIGAVLARVLATQPMLMDTAGSFRKTASAVGWLNYCLPLYPGNRQCIGQIQYHRDRGTPRMVHSKGVEEQIRSRLVGSHALW